MVFHPPSWVPQMTNPPDSITVADFMSDEKYGRYQLAKAQNPYTCGITGKTYTAIQVVERVEYLARAIAKVLGPSIHEGTEWDRVIAVYSLNTIDYIPLTHAIHRISGIVTPASASYSAAELEHQLRTSDSKAIFTCLPLLDNALQAAKAVGIPEDRIFLLPMPGGEEKKPLKTVDDLIRQGSQLPELEPLNWIKGQGARQVAFLSYSSGTSGLPKAVMITHLNVIANVCQIQTFEKPAREKLGIKTQTGLGLLPLGHIYGLTLVAHAAQYRGDSVIILPRFELATFLSAVQRFRIELLSVVPPILIQMLRNGEKCNEYDLSSVRYVNSGAAPLGKEVMDDMAKAYPQWKIAQAYGMTEASPVVTSTGELDIFIGSSGSLLPGIKVKIIDTEGKEVTQYDTRGEMLVQAQSVVPGYLNNEKANTETFVWDEDGRWLRTGDEVVARLSPQGYEHYFVVDRIKELIKVKAYQVAPAELEAHLLTHPFVADCTVIPVPDASSGEAPKAFVVKSPSGTKGKSDEEITQAVVEHVEKHKARHKWLKGGVEFIDEIPKSASGKILRRLLKDEERKNRREGGAKL